MRILLDECLNPRLRLAFPGDEVRTVADMEWRALKNGALLKKASARFDVFITLDRNLALQNPVGRNQLGILILATRFNDLATYRPNFSEIRDMARQTKPGEVKILQIP